MRRAQDALSAATTVAGTMGTVNNSVCMIMTNGDSSKKKKKKKTPTGWEFRIYKVTNNTYFCSYLDDKSKPQFRYCCTVCRRFARATSVNRKWDFVQVVATSTNFSTPRRLFETRHAHHRPTNVGFLYLKEASEQIDRKHYSVFFTGMVCQSKS